MFGSFKTFIMTGACSVLALVAAANAGITCLGIIYEPELPEALKKDMD